MHRNIDAPFEQRFLELLDEDAARADLAERLRAVPVTGRRYRNERDLDSGTADARRSELRLREREPTAAAADADQHSVSAVSPAGRTTRCPAAGPERMLSVPATAADDPSACRASASLVLAETKEVAHRLSIDHPVGRHRGLLHAYGRQMQQLVDDLRSDGLDRFSLAVVEPSEQPFRL